MLLEINPYNIDQRKINTVVDTLKNDGTIIFPTDSVYAIGCSLDSPRGIKELARLKGVKTNKTNFSLICHDLSTLSEFTKHVNRPVFKAMNKALPGPYTFILNASNRIPKLFNQTKKTVGIRIPDNEIVLNIVQTMGTPLVVTSVHDEDEILEYTTDPYQIYERFEGKVDIVIDGGYGHNVATTVLDCTNGDIEVIREGIGEINFL